MTNGSIGRLSGALRIHVSRFAQTPNLKEAQAPDQGEAGYAGARQCQRPIKFRQYADEAMRWAFQSKTENEKEILVDLARTWTQAAVWSERTIGPTIRQPRV